MKYPTLTIGDDNASPLSRHNRHRKTRAFSMTLLRAVTWTSLNKTAKPGYLRPAFLDICGTESEGTAIRRLTPHLSTKEHTMSSRTLPGVIYHTTTMRQAIREADAEVATLTASLRARAFSAPRKPSQITMRGTDTRLNPTTVAPQVVTASWPPPVLAAAGLDIGEGVGHDGGMGRDTGFALFVLFAAALACLIEWAWTSQQIRLQACSQRTCKTEHTVPRLNRYGECLCVEVAQ